MPSSCFDNTYKLCCRIKFKTLSDKDFKKPWITLDIQIFKKDNIILYSTVKIKFPKIFLLNSGVLSPAKLDNQKRFIMNIKLTIQKIILSNNIINTKNRKVENCIEKVIQDDVDDDSEDIADIFNDYFVDIGKNIAESIGRNNADHLDYMKRKRKTLYSNKVNFVL